MTDFYSVLGIWRGTVISNKAIIVWLRKQDSTA